MICMIVAMTIAYESSNQSIQCQAWVAKTIQVRSEERNLSPKKVCLQKSQFSCWYENGKATQSRELRDFELSNARKAWEMAKSINERPNLYCNRDVYPAWRKSKKVKFLKQIGELNFYREKR